MALRFELVDYLHLAYKCMVINPPLTCTIRDENGVPRKIDTTIPTITCKSVWRFSGNGRYHTGVFFEGGAPVRKAYFNAVNDYKARYLAAKAGQEYVPVADEASGYKAGRTGLSNSQRSGVERAQDCLINGNVSCYCVAGYEADDLIYAAYKQLRTQYPDAHIDIFTGDMDMLPLVDDHTSVYMRGNRTWATPLCGMGYCKECKETCSKWADDTCKIRREFSGYFEVTPETWDEFISYRSAFKNFNIPYNSVYLFKMLRGDTSDNVPMVEKGWGAKKWNTLIEKMTEDGVQFDKVFRYDTPWADVEPILLKYFSAETVAFMKLNAEGIRPRTCMAELINCVPTPPDEAPLDVEAVTTMLRNRETFVPATATQELKARIILDSLRYGNDICTPVQLLTPVQPDLGKFQVALSKLQIKLSQEPAPY